MTSHRPSEWRLAVLSRGSLAQLCDFRQQCLPPPCRISPCSVRLSAFHLPVSAVSRLALQWSLCTRVGAGDLLARAVVANPYPLHPVLASPQPTRRCSFSCPSRGAYFRCVSEMHRSVISRVNHGYFYLCLLSSGL